MSIPVSDTTGHSLAWMFRPPARARARNSVRSIRHVVPEDKVACGIGGTDPMGTLVRQTKLCPSRALQRLKIVTSVPRSNSLPKTVE